MGRIHQIKHVTPPGGGRKPDASTIQLLNLIAAWRAAGGEVAEARRREAEDALRRRGLDAATAARLALLIIPEEDYHEPDE